MAAPPKDTAGSSETIATNRKARRDFHVVESFEVGIELRGAEVKSLRARDASLDEGYARIEGSQVILHGLHINPYKYSRGDDLDPKRPRRLLLHAHEIRRLIGHTAEKGRTLVPLKLYLKRGRIKLQLALCEGKQHADKRETLKRKTAEREAQREISYRTKR